MSNLGVLDGTWTWVWKEPPVTVDFTTGLIVRAANGASTRDPVGFSYQDNYLAWRRRFTGPIIAWTFLYAGSDPSGAAVALGAVDAVAYLIDYEDWQGQTATGRALSECVDKLRALRPGRPIGFSSYPTRAQAAQFGVDWPAAIAACDFVAPQMYYGYQAARYTDILRDAGPRYTQLDLEPGVNPDWERSARFHLDSGRGVSFWRLGILDPATRNRIAAITEDHTMTTDDVKAAVRDVLNLAGDLAVPQGQTSNDKVAQILVGAAQGGHNDLAALLGAVAGLTRAVDTLTTKLDEHIGAGAPAPVPVQLSGTWTTGTTPGVTP